MNVENNISLAKFSHLRVGGTAKNFYRPTSCDELCEITKKIKKYYILSGSSNILINDEIEFEHIWEILKKIF